ncbi:uncharacterized protein WCC33_011663 [Rhinophrynus dorsalis]
MDPEGWKMATAGYNFLKSQKEITGSKTLQVNRGKHLITERPEKRTISVIRNDCPEKLEGRLQAKTRGDYGNGFPMGEQGKCEMRKSHSAESSMNLVSKCVVKRWTTWKPDSMDHIENLAFASYDRDSEVMAKPVFGVQAKKLPIQVREAGSRVFLPQRGETYGQLSREDIKLNPSSTSTNTKEPTAVFCQKAKIQGNKQRTTTEAIWHGCEADHCEESSLPLGIPLPHPCKSIMVQNKTSQQSRISDSLQRLKATVQEPPVHSMDREHQKVHDKHRLPYKEMPSRSATFSPKESSSVVCQRTGVNKTINVHKDALFTVSSPSKDKIKMDPTILTPKEKPVGNTKHTRLLLIDSQGLPYTMDVEEPKPTNLSNLSNESYFEHSTVNNSTRSLAPRKVYTCPVCFRIFEYLSYLQRHSIAHSKQKPYVCKICGKAFKRTSHLTRHKYTHFGGKPSQCKICQRRFQNTGQLACHMQCHSGEGPHQCDFCHLHFGDHSALQNHILSKHVK